MADTTSAAPSEPVAGQCRFVGAKWSECAVEHVAMVLANPAEWEGYEVRYLYAAPQPVVREPLTDEQIESAAKVLAASSWDHMPEKGRETMRWHVRSVIAAATAKP